MQWSKLMCPSLMCQEIFYKTHYQQTIFTDASLDEFVYVMCEVNPEHITYVRYENGKKVLCVNILRAIYLCIKLELLWYKLFSENVGRNVICHKSLQSMC